MTDISKWHEFIEKVTKPFTTNGWNETVPEYNETHIVVPLNEYQIGNLLGAFIKMMKQDKLEWKKRGELKESWNTGDWFDEVISVLAETMVKLEIKKVDANGFCYQFVTEELQEMHWDLIKYDEVKTKEYNERVKKLGLDII